MIQINRTKINFLFIVWIVFAHFGFSQNNAPTEKLGVQKKINKGDYLYQRADSSYYKHQYLNAIDGYHDAAQAFALELDTIGLRKSYNDIGLSFRKLGQMDSARVYYRKALLLDRITDDKKAIIGRLKNIGITYTYSGNYIRAIKYYIEALQIAEAEAYNSQKASIKNALGNLHSDQQRYVKALQYYVESLELYKEQGKLIKQALVYNNIGNTYMASDDFIQALEYHFCALAIKQKEGADKNQLAHSYNNIGVTFKGLNQFVSAEKYLQKAYKLFQDSNDKRNLAETGNQLAGVFLESAQVDSIFPYLEGVLSYARRTNNFILEKESLKHWAMYYALIGSYKKAYENELKWGVLQDSLFNIQKISVPEAWNQYELQQKENINLVQKQRADSEKARAENRLMLLKIALIVFMVLLIFLGIVYLQKRKIKILNTDLDLLNMDIVHRKNNDYQRVLQELRKAGFKSIQAVENMLYASSALDDMLSETPKGSIHIKKHLDRVLKEKFQALNLKPEEIHLEKQIGSSIVLAGDVALRLTFILSELITNSNKHALKAKEETSKIRVYVDETPEGIQFSYGDNGEAFPLESLEKSEGLGWQIIKKFSKQLGGPIHFERKNEWNVFSLAIKI
ncbi:tetratricopeptide repeat protein [Spongiimicrobium salis]|uniref:tetratricopeptide repeat protein n=1 Tax=Spongiimicrobium salis TaxID=1667022 RepID=UPI00374CC285